MGIAVIKPILVAQCGHCERATAAWATINDGSVAPDLFFTGFPEKGRMILTHSVIYLACRSCQDGLDEITKDFIKPAHC